MFNSNVVLFFKLPMTEYDLEKFAFYYTFNG